MFAGEMVTYMPIASPFVRLAGFWVDDALSFAMGWNYFFLMCKLSISLVATKIVLLTPLQLLTFRTRSPPSQSF